MSFINCSGFPLCPHSKVAVSAFFYDFTMGAMLTRFVYCPQYARSHRTKWRSRATQVSSCQLRSTSRTRWGGVAATRREDSHHWLNRWQERRRTRSTYIKVVFIWYYQNYVFYHVTGYGDISYSSGSFSVSVRSTINVNSLITGMTDRKSQVIPSCQYQQPSVQFLYVLDSMELYPNALYSSSPV